MNVKAIAFYLPQFHPIPENDAWWGKGYTEWTNVARAKPLYRNHHQPRLPADLGYYDLRVPETRQAQADLARSYDIHGFCYYYYWFGGKKLLNKPIEAVLRTKEPDFPFCICWANQNWTRRWDGLDKEILIAQTTPGGNDCVFMENIIPFLEDPRYIRISGKPLLLLFRPELLSDPKRVTDAWRNRAKELGLGELYLVKCEHDYTTDVAHPETQGFDACYEFPPHRVSPHPVLDTDLLDIPSTVICYDYPSVALSAVKREWPDYHLFRGVMLEWDNTPRTGARGLVFENYSVNVFEWWLTEICLQTIEQKKADERLVFINGWNEWGEGAYLEPDDKYGHSTLQATKRAIHANKLSEKLLRSVLIEMDPTGWRSELIGDYFGNQRNLIADLSHLNSENSDRLSVLERAGCQFTEKLKYFCRLALRKLLGHCKGSVRNEKLLGLIQHVLAKLTK